MDWLAWLLTFAVVVYATALSVKTGVPLLHFRKVKDRVIKVNGEIHSVYGEEVVGRKNKKENSFYPIYSCVIDGKEKMLNGLVRYLGNPKESIGIKVTLLFDRKTGEIWCEKDLPLMKKQIFIRLIVMILLLGLMILTSVML